MKKLTPQAISSAFYLLLFASPRGETTTLEVKTLLRYLGFFAEQNEVSEALQELASAGANAGTGLEHYTDDDGDYPFTVYALPDSMAPVSDVNSFQFR
jgi:hypothetical protein